jgi:lipopolysaccharide exporter
LSLFAKAVSGVKWNAFASAVAIPIQFAQLSILAHYLPATAFGLVAMAQIAVGFAQSYADMGLSNALIYQQSLSRAQRSSLFWMNLTAGVLLFAVIFSVAPLLAHLFNSAELQPLLRWSALIFLIVPCGQQFQALLEKDLRFRLLAGIEVGALLSGFVVAVSCAIGGRGVYSLVWGQLAYAAAKAFALIAAKWTDGRPALHWDRNDVRDLFGFGLFQMGERSINYFSERFDQVIIGSILGPQALGYYSFASNIAIVPISRINAMFTRVAFPVFSKVQSDASALRRGYLRLLEAIAFVNFPVLLGIAAVAPTLMPVAFGEQWQPAVPLVQILAAVSLLRATGNPVGALLLSQGRADWGFHWNLLHIGLHVPVLLAGAYWLGAQGVALSLLLLQLVLYPLNYRLLVRPILGACFRSYALACARSLLLACVMCVAVATLDRYLQDVRGVATLAIEVAMGAVLFIALAAWLLRRHVSEYLDLMLRGRA